MKILQVVDSLSKGSGVANVVMNWYRKINKNKVSFDFLVRIKKENSYDEEIRKLGGNVFYIEKFSILRVKQFEKKIEKFFLENREYDIVHIHAPVMANFYFKKMNNIKGKKVLHCHSTKYSSTKLKSMINYWFCEKSIINADSLVACSKKSGEFMYKNKDFTLIENGIDYDKFLYNSNKRNEIRKENKVYEKIVFGHIGRFENEKNHKLLIEIFYELQKNIKNSELWLVGDGSLRKEIEKYCNELDIFEKVKFWGVREDVHNILQGIDCIIFPSKFEGFPLTCIEAQVSGTPCVISDTITEEVCLTELIKRVSLEKSAAEWSEEILKFEIKKYEESHKKIETNKFKLEYNVKKLEEYYCRIARL